MFPTQISEKVKVAQSCPAVCHPMDCSLPGSSAPGILQARTLEWVAIFFSRGSSWPRDQTQASRIADRLYHLSHRGIPYLSLKHIKWFQVTDTGRLLCFSPLSFHYKGTQTTLKLPRLSDIKKLSWTFTLLFLMFHFKIKPNFAYMYPYCYFLPIKPFHYKKTKSCKHDIWVSGIINYNSLVYTVYIFFLYSYNMHYMHIY